MELLGTFANEAVLKGTFLKRVFQIFVRSGFHFLGFYSFYATIFHLSAL